MGLRARARCQSTVTAGIALLFCLHVGASERASTDLLEQEMQREFTLTSTAVRDRLQREAVGDLIGAQIAQRDAETHRYRFLDLRRKVMKDQQAISSPLVDRSPFVPDFPLLPPHVAKPSTVDVSTPKTSNGPLPESDRPSWDLYRSRSSDPASESGSLHRDQDSSETRVTDMYAKGTFVAPSAQGASVTDDAVAKSTLTPRTPFFVYREAAH